MERLEATRQRVLSIENERRKSIIDEFSASQKMKDDTFQRELELRKLRKKQNVSVSNVQNSMKKLIEKLKEG